MANGELVPVSPKQTEAWFSEGRSRVLEEIKSGTTAPNAYNFLGRMRFNEDRHLIESWLKDTRFSTGTMQSSSSDTAEASFAYTARSYKRHRADQILARWDNLVADEGEYRSYDRYHFLGTLKCSARFATAPKEKEGTVHLYLIPAASLERWSEREPEHYLKASLSYSPRAYRDGKLTDVPHGKNVDFIIYGVTPGKYRAKIIWDKVTPFCREDSVLCMPTAGDYESTASPVIDIKKGEVTDGITIECTRLVKN